MGVSHKKLKMTSEMFDMNVHPRTTIASLKCNTDTTRKVKEGDVFNVSVIGKGGAPKKSKSNEDIIFDNDDGDHNIKDDENARALWNKVFSYCVDVTNKKDFDTVSLLKTIDKDTLTKLSDELCMSKARVSDKLFNVVSKMTVSKEMQKVIDDLTFNLSKFKKAVGKNLYASSLTTNDKFEAGILAGAFKQIASGWT